MKPWPADAVMLVAPSSDNFLMDPEEPFSVGQCRDCGRDVVYRLSGYRKAEAIAADTGERPIEFFCIPCCVQYDRNSLDILIDERKKP